MRRILLIVAAFLLALVPTYFGLKASVLRMDCTLLQVAVWFPLGLPAMIHPFTGALAALPHYQLYVAAFGYLIYRKSVLWSLGVVLAAHAFFVLLAVATVRLLAPGERW